MAIEMVKVQKDGVQKEIQKKDLPKYLSMGWTEVVDFYSNIMRVKKVV